MKKILFRKILIDCFNFFLITLISASVIIWVFQAVNYLDIMIEDGRSFFVYTSYTLLNLPKIISKIFPFALFFSFFFILNKYELRNELLIFWTLGINKIEFVKFFVAISFLIVFLQITLTALIVPMSQSYARTLIKTSNIDFFESFIKPKRFNDTINNLTIYADEKDKDGVLKNIYLKKSTTHDNFQITYAKKGFFKNINGNNILVLYDGETINVENKNIINFNFSESDFGLNNFKTNTTTQFKIQETNTLNLFKCVKDLSKEKKEFLYENCSIKNLDNMFVEIFKRLLIPFYIPILVLISLFSIIKSKENKDYTKLKILIFLVGIVIIILSETSLRFIENDFFKNIKIIFIPFIFFLTFYFYLLIKFSTHQRLTFNKK
jgi:lipopolysaccharide export system permease protein